MEDTGAAIDSSRDSTGVEEVSREELEAVGGSAGEGEEVGGVGAGEDGGVDGGVTFFKEGLDQP